MDTLEQSGANEKVLFLEIGYPFEEDDHKVLSDVIQSVGYWVEALNRRNLVGGAADEYRDT